MKRRYSWLSVLLALLLSASFTIAASGPALGQDDADTDDVSVGDIMNDPEGFAGQDVTVSGAVGDELDREAFTVNEDGDEILVVGDRDAIPSDVPDSVDVRGTVEESFNIGDVEDELGIRLNDRQLDQFEGEPFIMANDVTEGQGQDEGQNQNQDQPGDRVGVGVIFDDFETYETQQVSVAGEVEDILSQEALTIGADGVSEDLLVLASDQAIPDELNEEAIARSSGTLYTFDTEDEEFLTALDDEGIGVDPEDDLFSEYDGGPVLVASSVKLLVPALGQTVDNILDDTDTYIGATVNLYGEVADDYNRRGFALEGTDGFLGLSETNLLVLGAENMLNRAGVEDEALVQVQGIVYYFNPIEIEEEEDFTIDEEDDAYDDFDDGDPVVVATSVTVLATERGETIEDIINETDAYVGRSVTVAGNVNDVLTEQAFTFEGTDGFLGIGGDNLLVVGANNVMPEGGLDDDVIVFVEGTVYYFNPLEIEEEEGFDFFDTDSAFDNFDDGDAVIVARRVMPLVVAEED